MRRTANAVVMAVSAMAIGTARGRDSHDGSQAGTARSFPIDTAIDQDGVDACRLLTVASRRRLQDAQTPHQSCEIALSHRQLRLGGRTLGDEAAVKALCYREWQQGTRARVTVSADRGSLTFGLRRAAATELAEVQRPPTGWRIDSGVDELEGW